MASAEVALGAVLGLLLYAFLYRRYLRGARCTNHVNLGGKTAIVTGANGGIGKETALDLARRGARVVLACRDKARGETAACDIRRESGNDEVLFMPLDLASLKSVRAFAETFLRSEPRLDLLINNAGTGSDGATEDDFNMAFQVNHLGHFLLTHLLLDRLKRCAPSRVVMVASILYCFGEIDSNTIHKPVSGAILGYRSYYNSKLANILHARELANRLAGTNVTCYSLHPGIVNTEIFRNTPAWLKPFFFPVKWLFFQDPGAGAQTSIYCATQDGIERFSGRYFAECKAHEPRPRARDDDAARKLWELSERLLGLGS